MLPVVVGGSDVGKALLFLGGVDGEWLSFVCCVACGFSLLMFVLLVVVATLSPSGGECMGVTLLLLEVLPSPTSAFVCVAYLSLKILDMSCRVDP